MSLDCISIYQLVVFADFFCWDLLLELLEIYTTENIRFISFDLLGIYFQLFGQEHPFFKRYLFKAADLYRLPPTIVLQVFTDIKDNDRMFSTNRLKTFVRQQFRQSLYDEMGQHNIFQVRCGICGVSVPWTLCRMTVALCCNTKIHNQCLQNYKCNKCFFCKRSINCAFKTTFYSFETPGRCLQLDAFCQTCPT